MAASQLWTCRQQFVVQHRYTLLKQEVEVIDVITKIETIGLSINNQLFTR